MAAPTTAATDSGSALVRGLIRAGLVLVAGVLGLLAWRALVLAAMPSTIRGQTVPPGQSLVLNDSAQRLVNQQLGASLRVLALTLLLGVLIGFAAAGIRTLLTMVHAELGQVGGGVGFLVGMLWTPPVPVALIVAMLAAVGPVRGDGARLWLLALALGGVVAVLVSVGVGERWRRGAWLAGGLAGVASAGRALAPVTAALVFGEVLVGQPGVGGLLTRAIQQVDRNVVAAAVTVLLGVALAGQVVGAVAAALADFLDPPAASAVPEPSWMALRQAVVGLATLLAPVLLLAGSVMAGSPTTMDAARRATGPSSAHLLGTDVLGRDVLSRLLVGYRNTLLIALAAAALATVVGMVWGVLVVLVARVLPRAGGPVAEVLLAPGRLVMVAPLLLAGVVLVGAARWPVVLVLALGLAPRVATAVSDLARPLPASVLATIRTAGGVALSAWGVAMAVLVGMQVVGIGTHPPAPTSGEVLAEGLQLLALNRQAADAAVVTLLGTAPFLLAGSALLRHSRRSEALAALET